MNGEPLVWHYGLMAERWSEFITDANEVPYFLQKIAKYGQPVLDVGCGVGRVLLPLLRTGVDIDGCDISQDMLHYCRKKSANEGYDPNLYRQPMHTFELPRRYRVIYICGSFGLAGSQEKDLETLKRCYSHLEVGGALILNIEAEYRFPNSWNLWLPENRSKLPQQWPEKGEAEVASDGSEHYGQFRILDLDPFEQILTRQVRLEKWKAGELVGSEEYTLRQRMYFKNELRLMLEAVGFREIHVYGDYTDEIASAKHTELVFEAIR